jgi:Ca2+-binding RTX toxin-like protein
MPRTARLAVLVTLTALAVPAAANAGTVSTADGTTTFRAAAGETNDVSMDNQGVTDAGAPLSAGAGCSRVTLNTAACTFGSVFEAYLKDRDDRATISTGVGAVTVSGGAGDDTVDADSTISRVTVTGDGGNDDLTVGGESGQSADGGAGNDTLHLHGYYGPSIATGGTGADTISFRESSDFNLAVPSLFGGSGDDTIVSQPIGGGSASGGDGSDLIVIDGQPPLSDPPPYGSPVSGKFTISGGNGNDTIAGGPDDDTIDAGAGRDFIDASGGGADAVTCGDGNDLVRYDAGDTVAADCEIKLLQQ